MKRPVGWAIRSSHITGRSVQDIVTLSKRRTRLTSPNRSAGLGISRPMLPYGNLRRHQRTHERRVRSCARH